MIHVEKVLLVNVGTDGDVSSIANDGTFPALGIVALATVLQRDHPHVDVMTVDGQVMRVSEVEQLIRSYAPDVLGLSVLGTSYHNSLRLAKLAKSLDAVTILGNDHARALAHEILQRQQAVDYISAADVGEFAFSAFIGFLNGQRPIQSVPQLVYRTDQGITKNDLPEIPAEEFRYSLGKQVAGGGLKNYVLDAVPVPNRNLMPQENWDSYRRNYLARYGRLHQGEQIGGVTTINRARGCARAKSPCNFCGIADLSLRFSSPEMFWADVRAAQKDIGASIFYECFDSMSSSPRWVAQLVEAKPADIGEPKFFVYTQAAETTQKLVELYKQLGVYRVNMGLESGDTRMLKILKGPRDSLERNREACRLFKAAGMPIYGSLVLGGAGETHESLEHTVEFARWLIDNEMMAALEAQPLYPDPAATTGRWLMKPDLARAGAEQMGFEILDGDLLDEMPRKYGNTDMIDFDQISMDWCRIFSRVSWDELIDATTRIRSYAESHGVISGSARISEDLLVPVG